jgi:hypothetical protein
MQKLLSRIRASLLREVSATVSSDVEMQRGEGVRDATDVALGPVCQSGVCEAVATRIYPKYFARNERQFFERDNGGTGSDTSRALGGRSVDTGWSSSFQ